MTTGFEDAKKEIKVASAQDLVWFTSPDRKQFISEIVLSSFATLLISAFLAGFKEAAEEYGKQVGKKTFQYLKDAIIDLFSDSDDSNKRKGSSGVELEKLATDVPEVVASLPMEKYILFAEQTELQLKTVLETNMPPEPAKALANRVRQAVHKHMFDKEGRK